jgi:hypothetical protein
MLKFRGFLVILAALLLCRFVFSSQFYGSIFFRFCMDQAALINRASPIRSATSPDFPPEGTTYDLPTLTVGEVLPGVVGKVINRKDVPEVEKFWNAGQPDTEEVLERSLTLLFSAEMGDTLVGAKPISFEECGWLKRLPDGSKERLLTYLKEAFAQNKEYVLYIYTPCPKYTSITLAHIPTLRKTISESAYLSAYVKKQYGTVDRLVQRFKDYDISRAFKDEVALGIALGYGEENALSASRWSSLNYFLKKYPVVCIFPFEPIPDPIMINHTFTRCFPPLIYDVPVLERNLRFESMEDEWEWMKEQVFQIPKCDPPYLFSLPLFCAFKSGETQQILKKFSAARDVMSRLYYEKTLTRGIKDWVHKSTKPQNSGR